MVRKQATIGTVKGGGGGETRQAEKKEKKTGGKIYLITLCLENNHREWTGLEFAESQRAMEDREIWRLVS